MEIGNIKLYKNYLSRVRIKPREAIINLIT